jgi:hypothetical protein
MTLDAYCDDINEYSWFISLDDRLNFSKFHRIGRRGTNPPVVDNLITYDRPDVILVKDGVPVITIEKTREVPTGHNVGQRVARLVRSVEAGVPTVKFFPFDARKHGAHSSMCNLNARLLMSFENMWQIHDTPMIAVNWPSDERGELIEDESADHGLRHLIRSYIDSRFDFRCEVFSDLREQQLVEYEQRCKTYGAYSVPPPSLQIRSTLEFLDEVKISTRSTLGKSLTVRSESVVYEIGMSEDKCRREDPYTGTQFIYDYLYCRSGPDTSEKYRNLILYFPNIRKDIWQSRNPNDPTRKSSNWYLTANAHVYRDGWLSLR